MQAFSKFTVNEAMSEPELKHHVSVTVSDPQHTMVSKRKEKIEKKIKLYANDDKHAVALAKHHYKRQGYKVHDANYIGVTEATVDTADIEKKKLITPSDRRTISKVADLMAKEKALKTAATVKEEEQVDEITNKAIVNYAVKAGKEADKLKKHIATGGEYKDIAKNLLARRQKGLNRATNKLAKRAMMKDYEDSSKAGRLTDEVNMEEAVTVKKQNYSWGKMITVHDGSKTSYPLHPEHQKELSKLRDGDKTSFKDETGRRIHAHREGDKVHLMTRDTAYKPTAVPFHHFEEQAENPPFEGGKPNKGPVKDKSGAMHSAMSRAKHLAKMAASKEKVAVKGFKKFNDK